MHENMAWHGMESMQRSLNALSSGLRVAITISRVVKINGKTKKIFIYTVVLV